MFTVCNPLPQMIQDQAFRSVSPPKDVVSISSPIFSFTDPRHSPAFVQRMRNARPDPSQFKIKLFKVEMDIPGVEEALNPANPLGHMKRIGLSMAAMSFLSPNKCKVEENQNEFSKKDQDREGLQHETHEGQLILQENKSTYKGGMDQAYSNTIQATPNQEIPLLPVHSLSQAKWGQSQSAQHSEDFYSPSEYRKKIHDNLLLRDESIRQDDLACTQNTQDQRSSMFSQADQRGSLLTSSEQRSSQQSQSQQRTSLLSQNNQSKNAASNSEQPEDRPREQSEDSETFKEQEEWHSSLRIEQQNDSKQSWNTTNTEVDQFNPKKQVFPKIIKEHYGSMLLPSEGNDALFKEEEEEEDDEVAVDKTYNMSFSKKWLSKHKKHNNYSIDTPSFKHISHTAHTLPSFSFSESIYGRAESNFISQNISTLIQSNKKENDEGEGNNAKNQLLSTYLNQGQNKVQSIDIADKLLVIDAFHRKSDAVSNNINADPQQTNHNQDNRYTIYSKYDSSLTKPSYVSTPVLLKDQSISNVQQQVIHNDMPYERIEQIIEDSLKRTSALFEQIKEDKVKQVFNKVDIKPQENILQEGNLQSHFLPKQDASVHFYLNGAYNSAKNAHSLSNPLFKPVHQAYLSELSQKQPNITHVRTESNSSYNLNSYQQNPLHVEQAFSAPQGNNTKDQGIQNQCLSDNSFTKPQFLHSYNLKQPSSSDASSVSSNPYGYRIPDSKYMSNEAQHYPKTTNNTTVSSSSSSSNNWRNFSHLSSSVDYSMNNRKMPYNIPHSFNTPTQSLAVNSSYSSQNPQYLQTQGHDSQISLKQQVLNNEEHSGSSLSLKMHSHSLSPAPMQYFSSNQRQIHEGSTEIFKNILPSPSKKTIPSATVNLLSNKYTSSYAPLISNIQH